jgi:hypothetical protein
MDNYEQKYKALVHTLKGDPKVNNLSAITAKFEKDQIPYQRRYEEIKERYGPNLRSKPHGRP